MASILSIGYRHWGWVLTAVIALGALALPKALQVRLDLTTEGLFDAQSPLSETYRETLETFGSDQLAVIYAESDDLFSPTRLRQLERLNDQLALLPFVERIDSLFELPDIRDVDGVLDFSPLLESIPEDPVALERKRQQALENPLYLRQILSEDSRATLLTLYLDPKALAELGEPAIHEAIEILLSDTRQDFDALFQLGGPSLTHWMVQALERDQLWILPGAALILFLLLSLNLRSFAAGLLPIINTALASLLTLAAMHLLDLPVNMLNYIVPVLILIVGATEDVHLLHAFGSEFRIHGDGIRAMLKAGERIWLAIVLTAITTLLGFAATSISDLPILRQFGAAAVIGIGLRFAITIFVLPASLRLLQGRVGRSREAALIGDALSDRITRWVLDRVAPRVGWVILGFGGLAFLSIIASRHIPLSNNMLSFLDEDTELRQRIDHTDERFAGSKILFLTLNRHAGDFTEPKHLQRLDDLTTQLRQRPDVDSAQSFADLIRRLHQQLAGDPEAFRIPDSTAAVRQMLLFTRPDLFARYVTGDHARANIVIRTHLSDSDEINALVADIRGELDGGRFGPLDYRLTGDAVLVAAAVSSIVKAQVVSLGGMALLLFIIVSALFLSFRCGSISVLSNLFPIAIIFGLMGLLQIPLNVGTCMVAAITLGIAIDDTIHLLIQFNRHLRIRKNEEKAMQDALRHELNPVVTTSVALAGGFLVLGFSSFEPVREFGGLSATVMLLALITDLIVVPVFFSKTRLVTLWDMLGLQLRKSLLARSPFFQGLSAWQARKIVLASNVEEFSAGTRIIRENEIGRKMYVVVGGELEASLKRESRVIPLAQMAFGDVFGEIGMVTETRRSADITATSDARLLVLDLESMESLKRFSPYLASRLFLNLSTILALRLAKQNESTRMEG